MAVLSNEIGMSSPESESTGDSSHENNLYYDRQFQNKLLQVDEDSDIQVYEKRLSNSGNNVKLNSRQNRSDNKGDDISGWFPSAKFVGRRTDLGNFKSDPKPQNTFIHPWKDYKRTKKEETYSFKHYTDHGRYIEQYRNEHGCHSSHYRSATHLGEMRRIAFQVHVSSLLYIHNKLYS